MAGLVTVLTKKVCHSNFILAQFWQLLQQVAGDDVASSLFCRKLNDFLKPASGAVSGQAINQLGFGKALAILWKTRPFVFVALSQLHKTVGLNIAFGKP